MSTPKSDLAPGFIAKRKAQLLDLREQITRNRKASAGTEAQLQSNSLNRSEGSGDDAQKTSLRDNNAARYEHSSERLKAIDRALQKIEDGTYGLSDESGDPIPQARLEARPESALTVEESARQEQAPEL